MPEVIHRYHDRGNKSLPVLYTTPHLTGKAVLVNPKPFKEVNDPVTGSYPRHRMDNPHNPNTFPFKALSMEDTGLLKPIKITDDPDLPPSWKRSWWDRNQHTWKPFGIGIGIGLAIMILALLGAEYGAGQAHGAAVASTDAGVAWGPGDSPVPAPMPARYRLFCPDNLNTGSGIKTLEMRFPEMRCALLFVPVGQGSEGNPPGE